MLTGYMKHVSDDGIMRFVVDSLVWKHIDNDPTFGNFGAEVRNMHLALSLDGVNPFKLSNTNWSTWPVLILIYNFEPWFLQRSLHFFVYTHLKENVTNIKEYGCLHTTLTKGATRIVGRSFTS